MTRILSLVAVATLAAGCASTAPEAPADGVAAKEDEKPELRCRYVKTTSSRIGAKECEVVEE